LKAYQLAEELRLATEKAHKAYLAKQEALAVRKLAEELKQIH